AGADRVVEQVTTGQHAAREIADSTPGHAPTLVGALLQDGAPGPIPPGRTGDSRFPGMSFRRPEHPERVAIVVVVLLAVVTIAVLAGASQVNGPAEVKRPVAIVQLIPNEGELVSPQRSVGTHGRSDVS